MLTVHTYPKNNLAFLGPFFAQCTFVLQQVSLNNCFKNPVPQVMYLIDHYMNFKVKISKIVQKT
jgi:hypothetical protein